jgi:hypothetical protein
VSRVCFHEEGVRGNLVVVVCDIPRRAFEVTQLLVVEGVTQQVLLLVVGVVLS